VNGALRWEGPGDILGYSGSYWGVCALHAAVRLDLFTVLGPEGGRAVDVAEASGSDERACALLLDAVTALGLIEKREGRYLPTAAALRYLSAGSDEYLGHIILHHHYLMETWAKLPEAVVSGAPVGGRVSRGDDPERRKRFLMGMFNMASLSAPKIVPHLELGDRRRLLDLGGGPGTYAIHMCRANPLLRATVYDLETTRPFAEATIARFGMADRIEFVAGDFNAETLAGTYDAAWMSHILHAETEEECRRMIAKVVDVLEPGGIVMIHEFILNDEKTGPLFPALFSLNMLVNTPGGRAYAEGEIRAMLEGEGVRDVRRLSPDLPNGAGVIVGRV